MEIEYRKDFAQFQSSFKKIKETGFNKHFQSAHVELDHLVDIVYPLLLRNNICVSQPIHGEHLCTILAHVSGFKDVASATIPYKGEDPQKWSSCITYMRRVCLLSILGIAPSNSDDDGEGAVRPKSEAKAPKKELPPTKPTPQFAKIPESKKAELKELQRIKKIPTHFLMNLLADKFGKTNWDLNEEEADYLLVEMRKM